MLKKQVKIPVIVLSSVVGAVLIAVIVMACVVVRPLNSFMAYDNIRVSASQGDLPNGSLMNKDNDYKQTIDTNLKKTGFSVLRACMELVYSYGPKFETATDDDGKEYNVEVTIAEAKNACNATSDAYKLQLEFETMQTFTVDKTEIQYDRVIMRVKNTESELAWVTVYLYRSDMDGVQSVEAEDYRVTPILMRMNTTPLYLALGTIAQDMDIK